MDYNTPVGNPELKDALLWPSGCQELRVRSVYVPPGVHARLTNPNKLSFFEHIAKNVGLRAARGEYVLVTNPDILLNEDASLWVRIPQSLGWDLLTFLLAALWLHTLPREDR